MAREVGIEGKLGGQASVPGAAGTWRDLTDNVNRLAANLTTQVRAIAEVATAVTKGDLSRSIDVEAAGEVAALKDNINEMIFNLRDTTEKNTAQDWLKTNLAKFTRLLQGQRDLITVSRTDPLRAGAAGLDAARRVLRQRRRRTASRSCGCSPATPTPSARTSRTGSRPAKAWSARPRSRSRASCSPTSRPTTSRSAPASAKAKPMNIVVHAGAVRRRGQGGDRARLLLPLQRHPPHLPQPAHRRASASSSTPSPRRCGPRSC